MASSTGDSGRRKAGGRGDEAGHKPDAPGAEEGAALPAITRTKEFVAEVQAEFGKIVWPDKKHTAGTTMVVIVLVTLISLYLGGVDLFLGWLVQRILG
ncbi:MAG: preprotein translocase subunit SecE [Thermodesulfobacteriota bacterium]